MKKCIFLYALCFLETSFLSESQAADPPGLSEVIARHKQTLESISSLHLKMEVSYNPELTDFGNETTECWLDRDNYRVIYRTHGEISVFMDTYVKGNIKKSYSKSNKEMKYSGSIGLNVGFIMGNPLPHCLFRLSSSGETKDVPFWTLIDEQHHSTTIENTKIDGDDYVIVTLSNETGKQMIWFSKKHNYLVKKIHRWHPKTKTLTLDREVTEFREVSPGVYFPAKIVSKIYTPLTGVFQREGTIILKDIEINRPISQSVFESNFPADVLVYDAIKQKIWRTDDAGEIGVEAQSPDSRWGFLIANGIGVLGFVASFFSPHLPKHGWVAAALTMPPIAGLVLALVFC